MRAILCCMAALAGCAQEPALPTVTKVPVPVPCLSAAQVPALPAVKGNAELAALPDEGLVLEIAAERLELIGYSLKADAVIRACAK